MLPLRLGAGTPRSVRFARQPTGTDGSDITTPVKVWCCDDSPEIRELVAAMLEDDDELQLIGESEDGQSCVDAVSRAEPDVILLDVEMPVLDGLEALPLLRERAPDAHVVVWSSHPSWEIGPRATALGADAVLRKSDSFTAVREAMLAAARGEVTPS